MNQHTSCFILFFSMFHPVTESLFHNFMISPRNVYKDQAQSEHPLTELHSKSTIHDFVADSLDFHSWNMFCSFRQLQTKIYSIVDTLQLNGFKPPQSSQTLPSFKVALVKSSPGFLKVFQSHCWNLRLFSFFFSQSST